MQLTTINANNTVRLCLRHELCGLDRTATRIQAVVFYKQWDTTDLGTTEPYDDSRLAPKAAIHLFPVCYINRPSWEALTKFVNQLIFQKYILCYSLFNSNVNLMKKGIEPCYLSNEQ